jgi:hypothetical protein
MTFDDDLSAPRIRHARLRVLPPNLEGRGLLACKVRINQQRSTHYTIRAGNSGANAGRPSLIAAYREAFCVAAGFGEFAETKGPELSENLHFSFRPRTF